MKLISTIVLSTFFSFLNGIATIDSTAIGQTIRPTNCKSPNSMDQTNNPICYYIAECPYEEFRKTDFRTQYSYLGNLIFDSPTAEPLFNSRKECFYVHFIDGTDDLERPNYRFIWNDIYFSGSDRISGYCAISGNVNDQSCEMKIYIGDDNNIFDRHYLTTQLDRGKRLPDAEFPGRGFYSIGIEIYPSQITDHQIMLIIF